MRIVEKIELSPEVFNLIEQIGTHGHWAPGIDIYHLPQYFIKNEDGTFEMCLYRDDLPDDIKSMISEMVEVIRRNEPKEEGS
jgi:hypothetical protein